MSDCIITREKEPNELTKDLTFVTLEKFVFLGGKFIFGAAFSNFVTYLH